MAVIRVATKDDLFDLLVLAREFSREAPDMHRWDRDKTEGLLSGLISNPDAVIFVSEVDGDIAGFLAGMIQPVIISHTKIAFELAWFVDKHSRGGAGAIKLVKAFEAWAKDNGAEWVTMADITGLADLSPLYSKLGYSLTEKAYSKRVT
mgnify:FL=1|tara:strand:- start:468 stop:914 length:447 start_codon:yes stop_codon:yes gene_type:complete